VAPGNGSVGGVPDPPSRQTVDLLSAYPDLVVITDSPVGLACFAPTRRRQGPMLGAGA
jgi:hypothetical protein